MIFRKLRETSKLLIIIVVVTFALGGTLWGITSFIGGGQPRHPQGMEQGPLGEVDLDDTLLTINGEEVPTMEFVQLAQQYMGYLQGLPAHQIMDFQNELLHFLIERVVILQQAQARGIEIEVSDEEVEEIIEGYLTQMGMERGQFEQQIRSQGLTMDQVREDVRHAIWEQNLLYELEGTIRSEVVIDEEEIKEKFEEVRARNIFVKFEEHDSPEEARQVIEQAKVDIEAGMDFAEAAAVYSDSTLGPDKGGDLGYIKRGDAFNPLLIETAFSTSEGEVSDIFETEQGFHLIKVEDKRLAEGEVYERERAQIEQELWSRRSEAHYNQWLDEVVAEADVKIHHSILGGYYWMSRDRHDLALEHLREAKEENPDNPLILNLLGQAFFRKGDTEEAIETYEEAISQFPENWELYFALADVFRQIGQYSESAENLMKVVDLQGEDYYTMLQTLRMLEGMEEHEKAEEVREIVQKLEQDLGYGEQQLQPDVLEEQMEEMLEDPMD